jgi:hypothetical protein
MKISGLHLLLTYQCTFECDHCFVWGSPWQNGVMTQENIERILQQAESAGSVRSIYFEGGEPFLYYATLLKGVQIAAGMGFEVGIVSNAYWATSYADALESLKPFAGLLADLTISSDLYHFSEQVSRQSQNAAQAAGALGIPLGSICVAQPEEVNAAQTHGQLPTGVGAVMYRGRAAEKLVSRSSLHPWQQFTQCPHEDLRDPGRMHVDPFGFLHICQGITIGNIYREDLAAICSGFDPDTHPILSALLSGGPARLVQQYEPECMPGYADACHLCYSARQQLRPRFPGILIPDEMYGVEKACTQPNGLAGGHPVV